MFKQHKTFNLDKKRQTQKRNKFYQPKKCKYLKYIIPPILIVLFLFLILKNIDFDNEIYQIPQNHELIVVDNRKLNLKPQKVDNEVKRPTQIKKKIIKNINKENITEIKYETAQTVLPSFVNAKARLNDQQNLTAPIAYRTAANSYLSGAIKCSAFPENCTLNCVEGSVSYIDENLEQLQTKCPKKDLSLILNKCEFYNGILKKTFFGGFFSLILLSINECNLQSIQDGVFTHANVKNLEALILTNNQLQMLQATNLEGLVNLQHFELKQMPLEKEFKGTAILKPMALTVLEVIIQPSLNSTIVMDPLIWWQDLLLITASHLDLSHTNMKDTLNDKTFKGFLALETLILFNCNLFSFPINTFDVVINNLQYLDLRFNHLTVLDLHFFDIMATRSVELEMGFNEWFCKCDYNLFGIFEMYEVQFLEDVICFSPETYKDLNLEQLIMECDAFTTTLPEITPTTETTSTSATKTTDFNNISTLDSTIITTTLEPSTFDTTSTELLPSSKADSDSDTVSTVESSTTPNSEITSTRSTTVTTTTIYPQEEEFCEIKCYTNIKKTKSVSYNITKQMFNFSIYTISTTSVRIDMKVTENVDKFYILYYTNYEDYLITNSSQEYLKNSHITITALQSSNVYLFCLIKQSSNTMSPYDCQAHLTGNVLQQEVWLYRTDKTWFLITSILIALLLFLSTLFSVYCLLQRHPYCLLRGNKSILQDHLRRNQILMVTDKSNNKGLSFNSSPISQRSSNYLKALPPPLQVSSSYNAELSLYTSQHTIPLSKAPLSPPTCSVRKPPCNSGNFNKDRPLPRTFQCHMAKADTWSVNSDAIYQTIDHYETIYF